MLEHVGMRGHEPPLNFLCLVIGGHCRVIVAISLEHVAQLLRGDAQKLRIGGAIGLCGRELTKDVERRAHMLLGGFEPLRVGLGDGQRQECRAHFLAAAVAR